MWVERVDSAETRVADEPGKGGKADIWLVELTLGRSDPRCTDCWWLHVSRVAADSGAGLAALYVAAAKIVHALQSHALPFPPLEVHHSCLETAY